MTHRFRQPQLNKFLADLFETLPAAAEAALLPRVSEQLSMCYMRAFVQTLPPVHCPAGYTESL